MAHRQAETVEQVLEKLNSIPRSYELISKGLSKEELEKKAIEVLKYIRSINLPQNGSHYTNERVQAKSEFIINTYMSFFTKPFTNNVRSLLEAVNYELNIAYKRQYIFFPKFSDSYELKDGNELYDAIKRKDEPAIIVELDKIPVNHLRFVTSIRTSLLYILTEQLLIAPIKHLANNPRVIFNILYNQPNKEFSNRGKLPADILLTKIEENKEKTLELFKLFKDKDVLKFHSAESLATLNEAMETDEEKFARQELARQHEEERAAQRKRNAIERLRTQRHNTQRNFSKRSAPFGTAYYILGHGGDYNDKPTLQVPADYAVIAKTMPGQQILIGTNENIPLYDTNQKPYMNPFKKRNLMYLVDKYKYLAMFGEGSLMPNFSYTLLGYFGELPEIYKFTESGVILYPFRTEQKFLNTNRTFSTVHIRKDALLRDHVDTIVNLYKYSVYPGMSEVRTFITGHLAKTPEMRMTDFITSIYASGNIFCVTQSELFRLLPKGVYYNFVCRSNEYTDKLYTKGVIVDESMRDAISKADEATLAARKGLQLIIAEALGTRAPMMRRLYNSNSASASPLAADLNVNRATREKFRKIREDIRALQKEFSAPAAIALCDFLIANVDIFTDDNYSIKAIMTAIGRDVPRILEKLEPTEEHIHKVMDLYNAFAHTDNKKNIFKTYPNYLDEYIIDYSIFRNLPSIDIYNKYKNMPEYKLEFIHLDNNKTFIMILIFRGMINFISELYNKYPKLIQAVRYNPVTKKYTSLYICMLDRYIEKLIYPDDYKITATDIILRNIIEIEKERMDAPYLRSELADPKYQREIIYQIFEPYIRAHKLYDEFPTIREGMVKFGMELPGVPSAPEESETPKERTATPKERTATPKERTATPKERTATPKSASPIRPLPVQTPKTQRRRRWKQKTRKNTIGPSINVK